MKITLYYDDTCTLCTTNAIHMRDKNPDEISIISVDLGLEDLKEAGISRTYAMTYVCIKKTETGEMLSGMDAIRLLCKIANVKSTWLLNLPIIKQLSNFNYPILARNRYRFPKWATRLLYGKVIEAECQNGTCNIPPSNR